jgi:hypothetical protein
MIGGHITNEAVYPATVPVATMSAAQIFRSYVRFIGVDTITTSGFSAF